MKLWNKYKHHLFQIFCLLIMFFTVLWIGSNILTITFRGFSYLPECLMEKETIFALKTSLKTACISTAACFILSIPTAYVLTRCRIPCRWLIEIILELTMSLPYIVLGLSLLILFSSPAGKALKSSGFPVVFHSNGIILAQLTVNLPFAIKLTSSAFKSTDAKLEKIAGLLGASPMKTFFTILLPSCKNTLISAVILVWSRALGEFGATLMLVGVTRMKTETLPANIYLNVSTNNLDAALASASILLIISAITLGISNLLTRKKKELSRYE